MPDAKLLDKLRNIPARNAGRAAKAAHITQAIREAGGYRWVRIYDVDIQRGLVSNIAWSGPSAPAHPIFRITEGLTSRAIAGRKTINAGDVAGDPGYLTALDGTRAEIIVPILDNTGNRVIGTIDVASDRLNAFDATAQALLEECARLLASFWAGSDSTPCAAHLPTEDGGGARWNSA